MGAPPELAIHAEVDPKILATLCSSERSSLPASWSHILALQNNSTYHHLLTPTPCALSATRSQQSRQLAQVPPVHAVSSCLCRKTPEHLNLLGGNGIQSQALYSWTSAVPADALAFLLLEEVVTLLVPLFDYICTAMLTQHK